MEHIKSLIKEKKYILLIIAALVLAEIFFFSKYGYHWLKAVRYMILTVFMVFLGFIDQQKTIIPNKLLLFMFVIRAVILAGEITVKPSYWLDILKSAGGGMLLGFLIFFLARIFSRKSVGMGDVKLAAVLGWYLGGSLIWFDIVVSLSLAALYSIVQLILKKLNIFCGNDPDFVTWLLIRRGAYEKINGSDDDRSACGSMVYNIYFCSGKTDGI